MQKAKVLGFDALVKVVNGGKRSEIYAALGVQTVKKVLESNDAKSILYLEARYNELIEASIVWKQNWETIKAEVMPKLAGVNDQLIADETDKMKNKDADFLEGYIKALQAQLAEKKAVVEAPVAEAAPDAEAPAGENQ